MVLCIRCPIIGYKLVQYRPQGTRRDEEQQVSCLKKRKK